MRFDDAKESIMRYVEHGVPCGDFLTACLENNLMEAMGRADDTSRLILWDICGFIYNEIPSECHGSPDKVRSWIAAKAAERLIKAQKVPA